MMVQVEVVGVQVFLDPTIMKIMEEHDENVGDEDNGRIFDDYDVYIHIL